MGPEQAGYNVNLPNSINTNHVAGAVYVNLGARYVLPVPQLKSFEVYVGVQNLLDRDPPVAPSNQGATNNILFDTLGRTYRLGRAGGLLTKQRAPPDAVSARPLDRTFVFTAIACTQPRPRRLCNSIEKKG